MDPRFRSFCFSFLQHLWHILLFHIWVDQLFGLRMWSYLRSCLYCKPFFTIFIIFIILNNLQSPLMLRVCVDSASAIRIVSWAHIVNLISIVIDKYTELDLDGFPDLNYFSNERPQRSDPSSSDRVYLYKTIVHYVIILSYFPRFGEWDTCIYSHSFFKK